MIPGRFDGKAAIVTGGASGLGAAIALRLAAEGAAVLVADISEEGAAAIARRARESGGVAEAHTIDVRDGAGCAHMVERCVAQWDRLDVLVNSAGIGRSEAIARFAEADWDDVLDVNLKGTFLCCKAAFPTMAKSGGGAVINLASAAAMKAGEGFGAYGSSKAAVVQFTKVLALEGASFNIRANALCPTWIDTPLVQSYVNRQPDPEALRRVMVQSIPLGRIGTPDDVAAAALFLASDEAAFITGVALPVDGGTTCR